MKKLSSYYASLLLAVKRKTALCEGILANEAMVVSAREEASKLELKS
jgi:hypothetical protein